MFLESWDLGGQKHQQILFSLVHIPWSTILQDPRTLTSPKGLPFSGQAGFCEEPGLLLDYHTTALSGPTEPVNIISTQTDLWQTTCPVCSPKEPTGAHFHTFESNRTNNSFLWPTWRKCWICWNADRSGPQGPVRGPMGTQLRYTKN